LWCITTIVASPEKSILDLRVDLVQPLLGALGLLPVCFNLGLERRCGIAGNAAS
jgi:hypothetical protein